MEAVTVDGPDDRPAARRFLRLQPRQHLVGRTADRRALDDLVELACAGMSGSLVLAGEPGIGKTRLLDYVVESAEDFDVVRTAGVESEAPLGFAALHRLLAPVLDRSDDLPAPQRDALRVTFGLTAGPPPNRFLVGLATLTLLADLAARRPLICLVDDAQWLDPESLTVVSFVARRLRADGIGLIFGVRDGAASLPALDGLPTRRLAGLAQSDASQLLTARVPGPLDERVAQRMVTETGGNPLALLELAGELSAEQLAGRVTLPAPLPVGRQLEELFLRRVAALPPDTRLLLLLVAAAAPVGDPAVLWRAVALLGVAAQAADSAVAEGILFIRPQVEFRHPLIRSAVYWGAPATDRRRIHEALAAAMDEDADRDRRAWHLAAAAVEPGEQVAAELERSAERARSRGGYSAQAAFLHRAAELTPDGQRRASRLLAAASAHLIAGDPDAARSLLDQAAPGITDPAVRIQAQRLRAALQQYFARVATMPAILLDAVPTIDPPDGRLAREMLFDALQAAMVTRQHTSGTTLVEVARAARATAGDPDAGTAISDLLMDGLATRIVDGYAPAVPLLQAAVAAFRAEDEIPEGGMPLAIAGSYAADDLWDDRGRRALLDRLDRFDREQGALGVLWITLLSQASTEVRAGRFDRAEALYAEAADISASIVIPHDDPAHRVQLFAWQGREAEARAAQASVHGWAEHLGLGAMEIEAWAALTTLELSLSRYPEALGWSLRVFQEDPPGFGNLVLVDVVEAGTRAGDRRAATAALSRLADRAPASGTPWALGHLARGRALLADDDRAEAHYREAIDRLGATTVATELARSHLLYGEWLRRQRRRGDAREQLRIAHEAFATMGATGYAERARTELVATGERARTRSRPAGLELTPQETHVARLVADGETNAEIATRLFITASTVEYHLAKIFRKLDLTSRRQLGQALREGLTNGSRPPH